MIIPVHSGPTNFGRRTFRSSKSIWRFLIEATSIKQYGNFVNERLRSGKVSLFDPIETNSTRLLGKANTKVMTYLLLLKCCYWKINAMCLVGCTYNINLGEVTSICFLLPRESTISRHLWFKPVSTTHIKTKNLLISYNCPSTENYETPDFIVCSYTTSLLLFLVLYY